MELRAGQDSESKREAEHNSGPVTGPVIVSASARGQGGQNLCCGALDVCIALAAAPAWSPESWAR